MQIKKTTQGTQFKRFLTLMLAFVMVFSIVPFNVMADTTVDAGNSMETATKVTKFDELYVSSIGEAKEEDWFSFTAANYDAWYNVELKNISINSRYWLNHFSVYDKYGGILYSVDLGAGDSRIASFKGEPGDVFYISANSEEGTGNYSFKIKCDADEYPDKMDLAVDVEIDKEYVSALEGYGDKDFVKFTTASYESYCNVEFKNISIDGSYWLNHFRVYDKYGGEVGNKELSFNSSGIVSFKCAPNDVYYISVNTEENTTGKYSFKINCVADEFPEEYNNAKQVNEGDVIESTIDGNNDIDFMKFTSTFTGKHTIIFENISINEIRNIIIYDYEERQLDYSERIRSNSTRTFELDLEKGKTYYIKIAGYELRTGKYKVSIDPKAEVLLGDANGDGIVDSADATMVLRYVAKLHIFSNDLLVIADANKDGTVDSSDATKILRVVAKLDTL